MVAVRGQVIRNGCLALGLEIDAVMGRPEMSCPWTLLTERDVPKTYIPLKTVSLMLIILVYTCPCVILSQLYCIPQQFYPNVICAEGPKKS